MTLQSYCTGSHQQGKMRTEILILILIRFAGRDWCG
jgi:hypothetical protein